MFREAQGEKQLTCINLHNFPMATASHNLHDPKSSKDPKNIKQTNSQIQGEVKRNSKRKNY
jgi:hypothetical protein